MASRLSGPARAEAGPIALVTWVTQSGAPTPVRIVASGWWKGTVSSSPQGSLTAETGPDSPAMTMRPKDGFMVVSAPTALLAVPLVGLAEVSA